jgi:hypothetical protein
MNRISFLMASAMLALLPAHAIAQTAVPLGAASSGFCTYNAQKVPCTYDAVAKVWLPTLLSTGDASGASATAPVTAAGTKTQTLAKWLAGSPASGALSPFSISPAAHLSNLMGKTSGTVCAIGDSTLVVGPVLGDMVDPTSSVWGLIQQTLKERNPQITSWSWQNFAIASANESQPKLSGTATGLTLPPFFTDASQTWLSYVQAANCDALVYLFGTNASTSGQTAGSGAATFIRQNLEIIDGWTKVPNLIIVTNKTANPATDTGPSVDDANEAAHRAQAAFHRTFAMSNAAGYTTFPNLKAMGFGLVDLERPFEARLYGTDPYSQYFQAKPTCLVNGILIGTGSLSTADSSTVCTTTGGDYRMTFVFPAAGGATIYNYGGAHRINVSASGWISNYLYLTIGSLGGLAPCYTVDGSIGGAPTQCGATVPTTASQDVSVTVTLAGDRLMVTINGVLDLDILAPRYITPLAGGMPINVNFATAPTGSPTFNVTEFWEGIPLETGVNAGIYDVFGGNGLPYSCNSATAGCQGGNNINHPRSRTYALDREVIQALDWRIPSLASATSFGVLKCDNVTVTCINGVASATNTVGAGVSSSRDPLVTDDNSAGYATGTAWTNLTNGHRFYARSVAVGAAVWDQSGPSIHPGYISGKWYYPGGYGTLAATSVTPGANSIVCSFGGPYEKIILSNLGIGITTTDNAKRFQLAVYTNGAWGRPSKLLASTGDFTMTGTGSFSAAVSSPVMEQGAAWWCLNTESTTAVFRALSAGAQSWVPSLVGSTTLAGAVGVTTLTGVSAAQTYGTWPATFTAGSSWTDVLANTPPAIGFQVQ